MKKRGLFIILFMGVFFFLILINFVSAACPNSQRIMKLSSDTNAHGEVYDGTNYDVEICYNEIFQVDYKGVNPHACSAVIKNKIVSLSSSTNAHAQIPEIPSLLPSAGEGGETPSIPYAVDVCYGNLICNARASCNVSDNEKLIVSLSSETNAHLSISDYDVKICCKLEEIPVTPITPNLTNAYWTNASNSKITNAKIGDRVNLVAEGVPDNTLINFSIYKRDNIYITSLYDAISNKKASVNWTALAGTYYFKAQVVSASNLIRSRDLVVSSEGCFCNDGTACNSCGSNAYFCNRTAGLVEDCRECNNCPAERPSCVTNTGECVRTDDTPITICEDYRDYTACTNYDSNIAKYTLEANYSRGVGYCGSTYRQGVCNYTRVCKCSWEENIGCFGDVNRTSICDDGTSRVGYPDYTATIIKECNVNVGIRVINFSCSWVGENPPDDCPRSEIREQKCVTTIKMDFSNTLSLIIAVLIIIIFYLIVVKKKKEFVARKKRKFRKDKKRQLGI